MLPLDPTENQPTPAQTVSPDKAPDLKSQWDSFLTNPSTRAALLGFGIQALQGGYGSFGQQFGQALGAGLEAGGSVEAQNIAQQEKATDNARQDRALSQQMDIAKMNNATRLQIGSMKGTGAAKSLREQQMWMTSYKAAMDNLRKTYDPLITPEEDMLSQEDMEAMATAAADRALANARSAVAPETPPVANQGAPAPGQGGSTGQGGTPSGGNVEAPGPSPSNSQNQSAPIKNFKDKKTGQMVPHVLYNGQWMKLGQ